MRSQFTFAIISFVAFSGSIWACSSETSQTGVDDDVSASTTSDASSGTVGSTTSSAATGGGGGSVSTSSSVSSSVGSGASGGSGAVGGMGGMGGMGGSIVIPVGVGTGGSGGGPTIIVGSGGAGGASGSGGGSGGGTAIVGDTCVDALGPVPSGFYTATLTGYAEDYNNYVCDEGAGVAAGAERVIQMDVPDGFAAAHSVISADFDAVAISVDDCTDPINNCVESANDFGAVVNWETNTVFNQGSGMEKPVFMIADAFNAGGTGDFNWNTSIYDVSGGDDCAVSVFVVDETLADDAGGVDYFGGYDGFSNTLDPESDGADCDFDAPGPEVIYEVLLQNTETLDVTVFPMDPDDDPKIYALEDSGVCDLGTCLGADANNAGQGEILSVVSNQNANTVTVVVDSNSAANAGYRVTFEIN